MKDICHSYFFLKKTIFFHLSLNLINFSYKNYRMFFLLINLDLIKKRIEKNIKKS